MISEIGRDAFVVGFLSAFIIFWAIPIIANSVSGIIDLLKEKKNV